VDDNIRSTAAVQAAKPVSNYARLLAVLEHNLAGVKHESELAKRLRAAIRDIEERARHE
jgi:hypothetical protein